MADLTPATGNDFTPVIPPATGNNFTPAIPPVTGNDFTPASGFNAQACSPTYDGTGTPLILVTDLPTRLTYINKYTPPVEEARNGYLTRPIAIKGDEVQNFDVTQNLVLRHSNFWFGVNYHQVIPQLPDIPIGQWSRMDLTANDMNDKNKYPKSTAMYGKMVEKCGEGNVVPPPDWLTDDRLRLDWLKRDQNALLYFYTKKDKYKAKIQEMLELPFFLTMCANPEVSSYGDMNHSICSTCCPETLWCCCLCWMSPWQVRPLLTPKDSGIDARTYYDRANICENRCCPFLPSSQGHKLRQSLIKRMNKAGIVYDEDEMMTTIKTCFCQPCLMQQTRNITAYMYRKRWGSYMNRSMLDRYKGELSKRNLQFFQYQFENQINPAHPNTRVNYILPIPAGKNGRTVPSYHENSREQNLISRHIRTGIFHEYYKMDKCIEEHNVFWSGVHRINPQGLQGLRMD